MGDFTGSESHCEFIIAEKEQNVIKESLCSENEPPAIQFGEQNQAEQKY